MINTVVRNDAGLQFNRILEEIKKEADTKFDMNVSVRNLRMGNNGNIYTAKRLQEGGHKGSTMTDWALSQLSASFKIPMDFVCRIPTELRAQNFNYFLAKSEAEKQFMLRTYSYRGGDAASPLIRGFMSTAYTKFDDDLFLEMVGKCVGSSGDHKVLMYHRDERGMHLRIGFPDLQSDIGRLADGKPDRHMTGFHISNSEVGNKSVSIQPMVYRLVCTNGLMRWQSDGDIFRQRHIHLRENEMFGRVGEGIANAVNGGDKLLDEIVTLKEIEVVDPMAAIKKLTENRKYSQKLTDGVLKSFQEEPGKTQFSVMQAFTRTARNLIGDERVEVEKDASRLLKPIAAE